MASRFLARRALVAPQRLRRPGEFRAGAARPRQRADDANIYTHVVGRVASSRDSNVSSSRCSQLFPSVRRRTPEVARAASGKRATRTERDLPKCFQEASRASERVRGLGTKPPDQDWRRRPELNRGWRFCRPLPYRLATAPLERRSRSRPRPHPRSQTLESIPTGSRRICPNVRSLKFELRTFRSLPTSLPRRRDDLQPDDAGQNQSEAHQPRRRGGLVEEPQSEQRRAGGTDPVQTA